MTHKLVSRTMTLISKMPETIVETPTAPGNHLQIINHRILTIKMSAYLHVSPLTLFNKQWPNRNFVMEPEAISKHKNAMSESEKEMKSK